MKKGHLIFISLIILIISISAVSAGLFNNNNSKIQVDNLKVTDDGYDMYKITCDLKANEEIDYLEMQVVFYDDSGAILEKTPLAWNMNSVPEGQTIKVDGLSVVSSGTPAKAEVYFFDDVLSNDLSDAIYNETVQL